MRWIYVEQTTTYRKKPDPDDGWGSLLFGAIFWFFIACMIASCGK